jgi:predicted ATPase
MKRFKVQHVAQIIQGDVQFGDFNVFIGPQASGKSIFLQLIKLALDAGPVKSEIKKHGYTWENTKGFIDLYMGEGMGGIIQKDSKISVDSKDFTFDELEKKRDRGKEEVFLIPAQRVVTIQDGWPRNFQNYQLLDPFVVKSFSESLRLLMEKGVGSGKESLIFPQEGRMKKAFRDKLNQSIFYDAEIKLDKSNPKKRILLNVGNNSLPYMTWSAGQREFMPLLLGLYWLMPSSKISKREKIKWVIIEEPEMGLHPDAIQGLILTFLELISRGYKVIISTHSPLILEFCWTINRLKEEKGNPDLLFKLFDLKKHPTIRDLFETIIKEKEFKTHFFERKKSGVEIKDISSLDPISEDQSVQEWGGLSSFSSRASELVSNLF